MEDDEPTVNEVSTYSSGATDSPPDLRLSHYNDVYHVEAGSREPVGGISRFQTLCNYYKGDSRFHGQPDLIPSFSGDAFNPSLESSVTKGSHMIPVLNNIGTVAACVGNHDLDFGIPQFEYLAQQCTFPWLLANVMDPASGDDVPLGHAQKTLIITSSNGTKIGLIGLVEQEWLDTLNSTPPNSIFKSASATAEELIPGLREQGAEIIIAITHQREPNDNKLAEQTKPGLIDIILGGHDHYYQHSLINGTHILRSGSDFKQSSYIEARRKTDGSQGWDFSIYRRDVVKAIAEDAATVESVDKMTSASKSKSEKPIGYTAAPLDARFTTVRLRESNLGNFVCDLMRYYYQGDCCIMAAGTIRGDQVYPPGVSKVKDIMNCFPFEDPVVVVKVTGKALLAALENSVGKYPALEGRFPQVSNITLTFDASKPEGSRILSTSIGSEPLDHDREYTLVTRDYMVRGKDGFDSSTSEGEGGTAKSIVSEENGMLISMILRQYFMSLKVLGRWKNWNASLGRHWGGVHDRSHSSHPVREPVRPGEPGAEESARRASAPEREGRTEEVPSSVGKAQQAERPAKRQKHAGDGTDIHVSDSEDEGSDMPPVAMEMEGRDRELVVMRKVMRKWWRVAGSKGHPAMCDEVDEDFGVHWTRGICPRLEGRIRMVNG